VIARAVSTNPRRQLLAGTAVLLVLRLALTIPRTGPVVVADEIGYLMNARVLAGGVPGQLSTAPYYHGGYSLPLAPLLALGLDPETTYRIVLGLNTLLAASLAPLLYLLLTRCFSVEPRWSVWPSLAAAAYPSVTILGQVVLSENLLLPLVVVWLLCFGSLLGAKTERSRMAWGAGTALSAVWLWATHGSMLVVVGLTAAVLLALAFERGPTARSALLALVIVAAGLLAVRSLDHFLVARNYGGHAQGEIQHRLSTVDSVAGVGAFLRNLVGQAWYLAVASLGMLVAAVAPLDRRRLRRVPRSPSELVVALALLAGLGLLVESALSFRDADRPDMLVYGRYTEVVVPPLLAVALVRLRRQSRFRVVPVVAAIAATSGLVALLRTGIHPPGPANRWNVASLPAPTFELGPKVLLGAGVVAAAVVVLVAGVQRLTPAAIAPLVLVLFLPTTAVAEHNPVLNAQSTFYPSGWKSPPTLHGTIAFDTDYSRGPWVYEWFEPDARVELFSGSRETPPAPFVVTAPIWAAEHASLHPTPLWRDPSRGRDLFRLAGTG
jgi:hypothetical protein